MLTSRLTPSRLSSLYHLAAAASSRTLSTGYTVQQNSDSGSGAVKKKRFLDFNPQPENEEQKKNLARFLQLEEDIRKNLNTADFTAEQLAIHEKHAEAIASFDLMYEEPGRPGIKVFTRLRHFLKRKCCGSACRHCVYDHENVKPERRAERRFNSSFWEDIPGLEKDSK